ncbi:hypothetical protein C0989_009382 [Termitomyces sp. Mn162]|nr:hypothetical protein C0989_009382 [Termitomyces sp. Mn162]
MAEAGPGPSAEERARYETLKNELKKALPKKRQADKQLSLELLGEGDESTATNDEFHKQPTPGVTTVVVPPATRTQELSVAQQKRIRDREYQRRKRSSASLRDNGDSDEEIISAASTTSRRPAKRARLADDD